MQELQAHVLLVLSTEPGRKCCRKTTRIKNNGVRVSLRPCTSSLLVRCCSSKFLVSIQLLTQFLSLLSPSAFNYINVGFSCSIKGYSHVHVISLREMGLTCLLLEVCSSNTLLRFSLPVAENSLVESEGNKCLPPVLTAKDTACLKNGMVLGEGDCSMVW